MTQNKVHNLLPFNTIASATKGDVTSINAILRHYAGYIKALSTRPMTDEYGNVKMVVDPDIQRRLEIKLITSTLKFRIA
ncbi:MAG: helix-turn-helix domain-containing protein [Clostridiales bacterium]|jgi:hypothetical protein|nr:helix-turn-helix domain-containing protein [Clostridiales bacterium]